MNTVRYRELRQKYGYDAIIILSVDFVQLGILLDTQKLAEEQPEMIHLSPQHDEQVERLKKRISAATGALGLSVDDFDLLEAEFMYKD